MSDARSSAYIDLDAVRHNAATLDRAAGQARDYFPSLKDSELPRYIIVSDFARIRLYDLEADQTNEFPLAELPRRQWRWRAKRQIPHAGARSPHSGCRSAPGLGSWR